MSETIPERSDDVQPAQAVRDLNVREQSNYVSQMIYANIRDRIRSGDLVEGGRLPTERRLMGQFSAARNTVRKALAQLERDGLIDRVGGSGTYVRTEGTVLAGAQRSERRVEELVAASPLDVLEARMAIEPGFVDLLVARATEDDFRILEEKLDRLEHAVDQQSFREAGYAFHLQLARATRNPLLVRIFEIVVEARANAGWHKLKHLNDSREAQLAQVASNRRILAALWNRDATLARKLMHEHLWSMISEVAGPSRRSGGSDGFTSQAGRDE